MVVFFACSVLGDNCHVHEQCTGTPNAGVCMADPQDNVTLICQCNSGFMTYNNTCLQGTYNIKCILSQQQFCKPINIF